MLQYLNFHTHQTTYPADEKAIYNVLIQESGTVEMRAAHSWLSVGVHPWVADAEHWQTQLSTLTHLVAHPAVKLIGECGLDRLVTDRISLTTQLELFSAQVQLAESVQKPVVIHCVKAYNELIQWRKATHVGVPLVVHGFNNKPEVLRQLLGHDFYVSLGAALLHPASNSAQALPMIPRQRLFLENDDRAIPVRQVYEAASELLSVPIEELRNQIWRNFEDLIHPSY